MGVDVAVRHSPSSTPNVPREGRASSYRPRSDGVSSLPQHYAVPIHHDPYRRRGIESWTGNEERAPHAETSLRRKTPSGTLNAGYDGSAGDPSQPHKHQLMPLSETRLSPGGYLPYAATSRSTFAQHQQRMHAAYGTWSSPLPLDPLTGHDIPPNSIPVMNSMIATWYPPYPQYLQTIPSVIQPSYQYLGPTASGGQGAGPYGPYWHDGTFVPYRPAAVRDPRFYNQAYNAAPGAHPAAQVAFQPQYWHSSNAAAPSYSSNPSQGPHGFAKQSLPPYPSHPPQHPVVDSQYTAPRESISGPNLAFNPRDLNPRSHPLPAKSLAEPTSIGNVAAEYGAHSPNGRHRDKVFSWALQQYRELLGFIQHSKKLHPARQAYGQHIPDRPSFFPKPPRLPQPRSPLRTSTRDENSGVQHVHTEGASKKSEVTIRYGATESGKRHRSMDETHSYARSPWHPSEDAPLVQAFPSRRSADFRALPGFSMAPQGPQNFPPYASNNQDPGQMMALPHSSSMQERIPPSRASAALAQLTALCENDKFHWTDGMHLCGCLAYALGDYRKALRWYRTVLDQDKKHLEARSNLAATLLALGQKQEAEIQWMKVIRVAPNHFEAVEHLIGLLCSEQRSRDAIDVIQLIENSLRLPKHLEVPKHVDRHSECSSSQSSRSPCTSDLSDRITYDFETDPDGLVADLKDTSVANEPGFGSSGFAIPGSENGRILALIHARGNMLYGLGDNRGASKAFEDAVLIATGRQFDCIQALVTHILTVVSLNISAPHARHAPRAVVSVDPILLTPDQALATAKLCFRPGGELPGLRYISGGPQSLAQKAVISTTSNSLLSLAKIFQDGMSSPNRSAGIKPLVNGVRDTLALYYLSLSLQPSPSTANNVGILLASVQQFAVSAMIRVPATKMDIPGVVPGSGIALALQYYNYGLQLDQHHAHLYTNLGSLLKDIGQLDAAINMYERAVKCDAKFDIALANLANAVKDKGRIADAIVYYKRAVDVSPDFAEAVCGLANALNSVCSWEGRGGISAESGRRDRWHVDLQGMLLDAQLPGASSSGWISRVVDIVEKQLGEGEKWGCSTITPTLMDDLLRQMSILEGPSKEASDRCDTLRKAAVRWSGKKWEGARITRLIERAVRRIGWHWYRDLYIEKKDRPLSCYNRPQLPGGLSVPTAPTVLPFHTFTCPMSAKQIRLISQRSGLRISVSTLLSPWLPQQVYRPPKPPSPNLRVGYVSSDFNNHPLAHLMQSVFGLHDLNRVEAYCYATTTSDRSVHRQQIEKEAPVFRDASAWPADRLISQIVDDGIHILVNLNGYTRGARNEVFAARPAPIQMSFMGFAGTLGAEWGDYLLADETSIPVNTLRPWRRNVDLGDQLVDGNNDGSTADAPDANDDWVYGENIIYCRDSFFCCDHKQSAPDHEERDVSWEFEQKRRWEMRKNLFPQISDDTIIFGNFNQLYKIEPTTFRTWLRILARVRNSILWLLRFPDLGQSHLLETAQRWAGADVASRVVFTDVAPKHLHIWRARICDLVLDTAECNAHTTAADVLWSATPLLTLPRYNYKMCSRMAASILKGALPKSALGVSAERELIASDEQDYEEKAVVLASATHYTKGCEGVGQGRLVELRQMLFRARWDSALFDTKRWVSDLEDSYEEAWRRWVAGEGGDIWLKDLPRGRVKREAKTGRWR